MQSTYTYISPKAKIHSSVKIGPFCYIGDNVIIDKNCELKSHVSIGGNTKISEDNTFYPFCSIGSNPQDLKFNNEKSSDVIQLTTIFEKFFNSLSELIV